MIVKNLTRSNSSTSSTRQLFSYLFEKERRLINEDLKPIIIKHNVRSHSVASWVNEFELNETYRRIARKNNIHLHHTILSFSPKDRQDITEKAIRDIARKFIELRGQNNIYVGISHVEKDHIHIHLAYPSIEYLSGVSNRMSKSQFQGLKCALDDYQREKYPTLVNSLPQHGRSRSKLQTKVKNHSTLPNGRISQKESLIETLEKAFSLSTSIEDLAAHIKADGHELYTRNDSVQGIKFNGDRKFRLSKLGDYKERITQLVENQTKEKQAHRDIQTIRQNHSSDRSRRNIKSDRER